MKVIKFFALAFAVAAGIGFGFGAVIVCLRTGYELAQRLGAML